MSSLTLKSTIQLSTGYAMPLLGFGVFQNYDAKDSVIEALRAGYRHIDSAQTYRNESQVGEGVRASGLDRSDVFITSKCVSSTHGYDSTIAGVNRSLEKFGFDYIDLFLIHDPMSGPERRIATYRALQDAQKAGKLRSVGVSNYNVNHLEEIKQAGLEMPTVNQIELHPFCQQKPIVTYCQENNIVVQAYCPLIRGKFDKPVIQKLAEKHGHEPTQVLLRWSLQKGYVPLPKSATPARIQSNTQIYDFSLDNEDMQELDALDLGRAGAISWNPIYDKD